MAVQILPQETSLSQALGQGIGTAAQGFGTGFGQGLQALAQHKLNQAVARHQMNDLAQTLEGGGGLSPQQARFIASLPEAQRYGASQDFAAMNQANNYNPQMVSQPQLQQGNQPSQLQDLAKGLGLLQQGNTPALNGDIQLNDLLQQALNGGNQRQQQQRQQQQPQMSPQVLPIANIPNQNNAQSTPQIGAQAAPPIQSLNAAPNTSVGQPATLADIARGRGRKEDEVTRRHIDAETREVEKEIKKAEKAANDTDKRVDRFLKIIEKGDIPNASFYKFFKDLEEKVSPSTGAGIGGVLGGIATGALRGGVTAGAPGAVAGGALGALIGPLSGLVLSGIRGYYKDTEEVEKLSADFIKDAKNIFGSRITDADLNAFMQTVPTLSQTDAGKKSIIRNIKNFTKATHVRYDTMNDIIKQNGGKRPDNLEDLIEERSADKLDDLAQKFVAGISV